MGTKTIFKIQKNYKANGNKWRKDFKNKGRQHGALDTIKTTPRF